MNDAAGSGGGSWIDLEGDGDLDLFVANGNLASQNNALYLNTGAGGFQRVTTGPVVTDGGSSIGGTWGDFDNDGHVDLFVTNRNFFGNFLYRGQGDTTFTRVTTGPPADLISDSNTSSWVDVDGDGDLDLYVVNFNATDYLFRNDGAFGFRSISAAPVPGTSPSIHGVWADYDGDRDPDLFLGIGGTGNDVVWRNDGNISFTPFAFADGHATLGGSWGDVDNDGDLDLAAMSFLNQPSVFYRNEGPPLFSLVPVPTSAVSQLAVNAVGSGWGDYDNDGDLDLFVGVFGANNVLFENQGPPDYELVRVMSGPLVEDGGSTFGVVWGDYDADGQLDLFVANQLDEPNFLYHNDGNANSWLTVRCQGTSSNRSAIGARVRILALIGGLPVWQTREVAALTGYNAQHLDVHFGLGDATAADSLVVDWPSGLVTRVGPLLANQLLTVVEGATVGVGPDVSSAVVAFDAFPNPFSKSNEIRFRSDPGPVSLTVFDAGGRLVRTLAAEQTTQRGTVTVSWDGRDGKGRPVPAGVYLYRLKTTRGSASRTVVWIP